MAGWPSDIGWGNYEQWAAPGPITRNTQSTSWRDSSQPDNLPVAAVYAQSYALPTHRVYDMRYAYHHPYAYEYRPPSVYQNYTNTHTPNADQYPTNRSLRDTMRGKKANRNQYVDFETSQPEQLRLTCDVSAQKIVIKWNCPANHRNARVRYIVECKEKESGRMWSFEKTWTQTSQDLKTTPGGIYCISVSCTTGSDHKVIAKAYEEIRAVFSYEEQKLLYQKCVDFVGTQMHSFHVLYRCKPKSYWDDIHHYRNAIMEKYIKDENGQPANGINGVISGLFFSARLLPDHSLPTQSPFGNVRMMINGMVLLDPNVYNFYFADFYCNYITHYATIVICKKRSETDSFCYSRLIKLNPEDNPFLRIIPPHAPLYQVQMLVNRGVWVEIYFTEDIPLQWGRFDAISATGAGTSKIGGLPNNKHCLKCNLYPLRSSNQDRSDEADYDDNDVADVTVTEDALNSTFHVLLGEEKGQLEGYWEDLVEVICALVDGVCEAEGEEKEKDTIARSDDAIMGALKRMDEELTACGDIAVLTAGKKLKQIVDNYKKERLEVERSITQVAMISRMVQSIPNPILSSSKLDAAPLKDKSNEQKDVAKSNEIDFTSDAL